MRLSREDYVARIASANRIQLVVINYELLLNYLKDSVEAFGTPDFNALRGKAQASLGVLMDSLDMGYDISRELMPIYIYVNKLIISSQFEKKPDVLNDAYGIISKLLIGWEELASTKSGDDPPIMENSQKIMAGLTYKNGELNEVVLDNGERGYRV